MTEIDIAFPVNGVSADPASTRNSVFLLKKLNDFPGFHGFVGFL